MRLFDIATEFKALYEMLENIEVDENGVIIDSSEEVSELYQGLEVEMSEKLNSTTYLIKEMESNSKALKDEAKRLTDKARVIENRAKRVKELMKLAIIESGETKVKTDKFSFNLRTSEVYNYDEVNTFGLDDEFLKVKTELDKTKIKKFVKAGGTIDGLRVSEDTILTVR